MVVRLDQARNSLAGCSDGLTAGKWDDCRKAVTQVLTLQTNRGYIGVSVKSRAVELGERGAPITEARRALLSKLGVLDKDLFDLQIGGSAVTRDEVRAALNEAIRALDVVIERVATK